MSYLFSSVYEAGTPSIGDAYPVGHHSSTSRFSTSESSALSAVTVMGLPRAVDEIVHPRLSAGPLSAALSRITPGEGLAALSSTSQASSSPRRLQATAAAGPDFAPQGDARSSPGEGLTARDSSLTSSKRPSVDSSGKPGLQAAAAAGPDAGAHGGGRGFGASGIDAASWKEFTGSHGDSALGKEDFEVFESRIRSMLVVLSGKMETHHAEMQQQLRDLRTDVKQASSAHPLVQLSARRGRGISSTKSEDFSNFACPPSPSRIAQNGDAGPLSPTKPATKYPTELEPIPATVSSKVLGPSSTGQSTTDEHRRSNSNGKRDPSKGPDDCPTLFDGSSDIGDFRMMAQLTTMKGQRLSVPPQLLAVPSLRRLMTNTGHSYETLPCREDSRQYIEVGRIKFHFTSTEFWLNTVSVVIIVANTILLGFRETDQMEAAMRGAEAENSFAYWVLEIILNSAFLVECFGRALNQGRSWLGGQDKYWNLFDAAIVAVSFLEMAFMSQGASSSSGGRMLRFLRIFRFVKLFRMFKTLRTLRLMVTLIGTALSSVLWAMVLTFLFTYMFALFIMQGLETYLRTGQPSEAWVAGVETNFHSTGRSVITLLACVSGGVDWLQLAELMIPLPFYYYSVFLLYIVYVLFGLFNVLNAIFVDTTKRLAEIDRELVIDEQVNSRESHLGELLWVFQQADTSHTGYLSYKQLMDHLGNERVQAYLHSLDVSASDTWGVFGLLDHDDGRVSIDDFCHMLIRLHGSAKNVDLVALIFECRRQTTMIETMLGFMDHTFESLGEVLHFTPPSLALFSDRDASRHRRKIVRNLFGHGIGGTEHRAL